MTTRSSSTVKRWMPRSPSARHEEIAPQVPVRSRRSPRAEPPAGLEHGDAVALLGQPQRGDAAAEAASDHEHVDLVRPHSRGEYSGRARVLWRPMRRFAVLLALVIAAPAAAATINGSLRGELILGTPAPDHIHARGGNDFVQAAFGGTDTVDCSGGNDVVSADAADRLAHCEIVSRRLSVDPYSNPDSQHETAVEPDSFSFGIDRRRRVPDRTPLGRRLGEHRHRGLARRRPHLAALCAALADGQLDAAGAGVVRVRSDGRLRRRARRVARRRPHARGNDNSHVYVARSADGLHWQTPVDVATGPLLDKDWFVCDNGATSPFRGRCYAEYTDDQLNETVSQFTTTAGSRGHRPCVPRRRSSARSRSCDRTARSSSSPATTTARPR